LPEGAPSRRTALLGLLALGGCGFSPALAPGGRGRFAVSAPATRLGVTLGRRLEDRLGRPDAGAPYALAVEVEAGPEPAAISPAQVTTRIRLEARAAFMVTEAATGRVAARGTAQGFTSYDATGTTVAEVAAARDAEDRLAVVLADRIAARLLAADLP
jgi:LPS-assembly lipoprotein